MEPFDLFQRRSRPIALDRRESRDVPARILPPRRKKRAENAFRDGDSTSKEHAYSNDFFTPLSLRTTETKFSLQSSNISHERVAFYFQARVHFSRDKLEDFDRSRVSMSSVRVQRFTRPRETLRYDLSVRDNARLDIGKVRS